MPKREGCLGGQQGDGPCSPSLLDHSPSLRLGFDVGTIEVPEVGYAVMRSSVELHVPDFDRARDFYPRLGFSILWERVPDGKKGYLVLALGDNVLCFWCGNERVYAHNYFSRFSRDTVRGYGVEVVIQVKDIRSYFEQVKGTVEICQGLKARPWGLEDFRLVDPYGFYLRFTETHDIADPRYAIP